MSLNKNGDMKYFSLKWFTPHPYLVKKYLRQGQMHNMFVQK